MKFIKTKTLVELTQEEVESNSDVLGDYKEFLMVGGSVRYLVDEDAKKVLFERLQVELPVETYDTPLGKVELIPVITDFNAVTTSCEVCCFRSIPCDGLVNCSIDDREDGLMVHFRRVE